MIRCEASVKNNEGRCKQGVSSGCVIQVGDNIHRVCRNHMNTWERQDMANKSITDQIFWFAPGTGEMFNALAQDEDTTINIRTGEEMEQQKLPDITAHEQQVADRLAKERRAETLKEEEAKAGPIARAFMGWDESKIQAAFQKEKDVTTSEMSVAQEEMEAILPIDFIVAGTGSRSLQKASLEEKKHAASVVEAELTRLKDKYGDNLVIMSGMAEGFDKLLALTALKLEIRLHCAIPNKGYGLYYWGQNSLTGQDKLEEFNSILERAEKVTYVMHEVYNTAKLYIGGRHANFIRNDWMVQQADAFLVWDPSTPGTRDCFATIKAMGKPFILLNTKEVK